MAYLRLRGKTAKVICAFFEPVRFEITMWEMKSEEKRKWSSDAWQKYLIRSNNIMEAKE